MKKRLFCGLLALILTLGLSPTAFAASDYYTDGAALRGSDYTDIPALASGLDEVFAGKPAMYTDARCSTLAAASIGSRAVPLGKTYYVKDLAGSVYSGTSCYIYANAVYSTLFGDVPYHGESGSWQRSERVVKNAASASYALFYNAGVKCGALLRTTSNSDGSYNGSAGHSIIILSYDKDTLTYLEGNGDGNGLIRVTKRSWDTFNSTSVSGKGYRISFIVQPTADYYASLRDAAAESSSKLVGYLKKSRSYDGRFRDVSSSQWFYSTVKTAYELGFLEGRTTSSFVPGDDVTVAESVTLAARFLSLYYDDRTVFKDATPWYKPYYDYCGLWGISTDFADPDNAISRADFAVLMARALPKEARTHGVNISFPDVSRTSAYYDAVQTLAQSGILIGSDDGLFHPNDTLTRAEAAAILARMADLSLRSK